MAPVIDYTTLCMCNPTMHNNIHFKMVKEIKVEGKRFLTDVGQLINASGMADL